MKGFEIVIIILLFIITIIGFIFIGDIRPTWDYNLVSFEDSSFREDMNTMGSQGWELVSARRAVTGEGEASRGIYECIFRRKE